MFRDFASRFLHPTTTESVVVVVAVLPVFFKSLFAGVNKIRCDFHCFRAKYCLDNETPV